MSVTELFILLAGHLAYSLSISEEGCVDYDVNCHKHADVDGWCRPDSVKKPWMDENCPLSCLLCDPVVPPLCEDTNEHCDLWARTSDLCDNVTYARFMRLHCARSCGLRGPQCLPYDMVPEGEDEDIGIILGGMTADERDRMIANGWTDDPNHRRRHSNHAYYALPPFVPHSSREVLHGSRYGSYG